MAPEVAKEESYDKSVDVYSFGILLWELCLCEKPFYGYSSGKHMREVVMGGQRPAIDQANTSHWPMNLKWLITRCWADSRSDRPSFAVAKQVLSDILASKESIPGALGDGPDAGAASDDDNDDELLDEQLAGGLSAMFRSQRSPSRPATKLPPCHPSRRRNKSWGLGLLR